MTRPATATGNGNASLFGRTWWGKAWVHALEQRGQLDPNRLPRGASYARDGSVTPPSFTPGEVSAQVTGRMTQPYHVRVRVRQFTPDEWDTVLDAIGARLGHAAALLDGDLPPDVAEDVAATGLSLLPGPGEVGPRCTCPDEANPCKHSAAVCYLIADALDADPFLVFLLRGRTRDEVLASLRTRRRGEPVDAPPTADTATVASDDGVDARAALARQGSLPPVPAAPVPPMRPGHPAALPLDPPPGHNGLREALLDLAADAATRAWHLAIGDVASPGAGGDAAGLGLTEDADLARRAARTLGTPQFTALAGSCAMNARELFRWGLAWRYGGAGGFDVLRTDWNPGTEAAGMAQFMRSVRVLLCDATGTAARVTRNRITVGGRQIRLGRNDLWYPYTRSTDGWEPAGPPHHDPIQAATPPR
jgi:uncharacterized Zn finger protein